MVLNMKNKIFVIIFLMFLFISCNEYNLNKVLNNNDDSLYSGKYKTEYIIYYGYAETKNNIIYTDDSVYTCSFQGTNFLLEKNNTEELLSTTAPIRIVECYKIK